MDQEVGYAQTEEAQPGFKQMLTGVGRLRVSESMGEKNAQSHSLKSYRMQRGTTLLFP